jgi:cyclophilin family peptidyl-prolyl cis-trans isomerase
MCRTRYSANLLIGLALLAFVCAAGGLVAQEKPEKPSKAGKARSGAQPSKPRDYSEKDWPALVARKKKVLKSIDQLRAESAKADEERQQAIAREFEALREEFQTELQPALLELAPKVFARQPLDVDAAEIVVGLKFSENRYNEVVDICTRLAEGGKKSTALLTFLGISQFALHDFKAAAATLEQAEKEDAQVFPFLGKPYLAACADYLGFWEAEQKIRAKEKAADDLPRAVLQTSKGEIVVELFENEAPNTVANFLSLIKAGAYDGTLFHRVIPNFMAQGGDPNTLDDDPQNDGMGGPGYAIACECYAKNARKHFQGSLSMAHAGKDSGGSQFFITHLPTPHLNANLELERGHTVFGRVIKGLDAALALQIGDQIESAKVLRQRDHEYEAKKLPDPRARGAKANKKSSGGTKRVAE